MKFLTKLWKPHLISCRHETGQRWGLPGLRGAPPPPAGGPSPRRTPAGCGPRRRRGWGPPAGPAVCPPGPVAGQFMRCGCMCLRVCLCANVCAVCCAVCCFVLCVRSRAWVLCCVLCVCACACLYAHVCAVCCGVCCFVVCVFARVLVVCVCVCAFVCACA